MIQKGFLLILVIILVLMILSVVRGFTPLVKPDRFEEVSFVAPTLTDMLKLSLSPSLLPKRKPIHLYPEYGADASIQINDIYIISLVFVPKDIDTPIKEEWFVNMKTIDERIEKFFERQFGKNIEITFQVINHTISGSKNIEEYDPYSLAQEAKNLTSNFAKTGVYNVWMIYLVRDAELKKNLKGGNLGGLPTLQSATQYEFWLDNEAVYKHNYGLIGSAHEFGHVLGIPHPWELPANINKDANFGNVPGDLMSYQGGSTAKDLESFWLRDDIKKTMGL